MDPFLILYISFLFTSAMILLFPLIFSTLTSWDDEPLLNKPPPISHGPQLLFYFKFPRKLYWTLLEDLAILLFEVNLFDKINNILGKISETEHCYVFMKENFRLFPSLFFKYLSSLLCLIIVNAGKINFLRTINFNLYI